MAKKTKIDIKTNAVEAALKLAEQRGWVRVTLADIAAEIKVSLADLHDYFEDKTDILVAFGRMIDKRVLEGINGVDGSPRDRLFDILMERFEALNDYRGGVSAVLESFLPDPKQAVIGLPHLCRSMTWMLEAAGMETSGLYGAVRVVGLTGIYVKTLKIWKDDESQDLAKVMAALDRDLGRAESLANSIGL